MTENFIMEVMLMSDNEFFDIGTLRFKGRVYMNKFDVIRFLEVVKKSAHSNECRIKLQRIINEFMRADKEAP